MKKILATLVFACAILAPALSQSRTTASSTDADSKPVWDHGDNVSDMTYRNVRVYRVLDQKDAYVVLYEKAGVKVGSTVIPKKWSKETPVKLQFRNVPGKLDPYMTVYYKNETFYKVVLNIPLDRSDASVWGVYPSYQPLEGTDADTLTIEF